MVWELYPEFQQLLLSNPKPSWQQTPPQNNLSIVRFEELASNRKKDANMSCFVKTGCQMVQKLHWVIFNNLVLRSQDIEYENSNQDIVDIIIKDYNNY